MGVTEFSFSSTQLILHFCFWAWAWELPGICAEPREHGSFYEALSQPAAPGIIDCMRNDRGRKFLTTEQMSRIVHRSLRVPDKTLDMSWGSPCALECIFEAALACMYSSAHTPCSTLYRSFQNWDDSKIHDVKDTKKGDMGWTLTKGSNNKSKSACYCRKHFRMFRCRFFFCWFSRDWVIQAK